MSNLFFTSDLHFGHKNIIKFCNRPFSSVEEMNDGLVARWNDVVKPNDTVWVLGDFAFTNIDHIKEILERLNGNIHMVLGNHDHEIIKYRNQLLNSGLVKEICDYKELRMYGQKICLFHFAQRTWNAAHHGAWHLFGHTHGTMEPYGRSVDVGVDSSYILGAPVYRPYAYEEIAAFMDGRPIIKDF